MYKINGQKVTKKEFEKGASMDWNRLPPMVSSMQPFQSPIDGNMINNSKDLARHNKEYNTEQVGNEYVNKRKDYLEERKEMSKSDELVVATQDDDVMKFANKIRDKQNG